MAHLLYDTTNGVPEYFKDRKDFDKEKLKNSSTLYIGNLSYYTTETQIFELFSTIGDIKRIIMGLNKQTKTPCGFCFVEYFNKTDAENAIIILNNTMLDCRLIRIDKDTGFEEGRQYGRGWSGAQKRDELSNKNDPDRPRDNKYLNRKKDRRDNYDNRNDRGNYEYKKIKIDK